MVRGLFVRTRSQDLSGRKFAMAERKGSISGLTDDEAQEFHTYYIQGFLGFTAIAVVAHILVWVWRPWL